MTDGHRTLLIIDGLVNLLLGILLLLFPWGMARALGLPIPQTHFYASLLGAVLCGIGLALLVDAYGAPRGIRGLGLAGAIVINFCGAGALIVWLIVEPMDIPVRGRILLWTIAVAVVGIGLVELLSKPWKQFRNEG